MEQPLVVNAENSRTKVQNVGRDSSDIFLSTLSLFFGKLGPRQSTSRERQSLSERVSVTMDRSRQRQRQRLRTPTLEREP